MKYPFRCRDCKKEFTLDLSISQYSKLKRFSCPHCESNKVVRTITSSAIVFKGTGFYSTDVRNNESTGGAS